MAKQVPLVDYLVLGQQPHLVARECDTCGSRYFARRSACASCSGIDFSPVPIDTAGNLVTYTIVSHAAEGIPVPFIAGVVNCGGTSVRGNIVNIEPIPERITLGMPLRLTTYPIGADEEGTEAIAYGFEPVELEAMNGAS